MILLSPGEQKKEAFRLFEDGRYQESLAACNQLLEGGRDPALEVLAATNLYYTGRYEDAEVFFRDLVVRMPDSSYVHSYLAKVLEARGTRGRSRSTPRPSTWTRPTRTPCGALPNISLPGRITAGLCPCSGVLSSSRQSRAMSGA